MKNTIYIPGLPAGKITKITNAIVWLANSLLFSIFCSALFYNYSYAQESENSYSAAKVEKSSNFDYSHENVPWYRGYTLDIGLSQKTVYFEITDSQDINKTLGVLTNQPSTYPSIFFNTPFHFFSDSSFGWYIEYGFSYFEVDKQVIGYLSENEQVVDMGTSVKGEYAYFTPTLYYNWGSKVYHKDKGHSFKIGIGIGAGYLKAKGNIVLTETTSETVGVDINDVATTASVILLYRINNISISMRANSPGVSYEDKNYFINETITNISYVNTF